MSKINILIADNDEFYIDSIYKYFMEMYSDRLNVIAYTDRNLLNKYISDNSEKLDVLLISPDMIPDTSCTNNSGMLIYLSDDKNTSAEATPAIKKYQSADKIISDVFNLFSENNCKEIKISNGSCTSKVITTFSPVGGAGKSTIAIALCKSLSRLGAKVFYLNMETIPSILSFLECNCKYSLSNIFYCIKENSVNLSLKIEAAKNIDLSTGISFFSPAESSLELEEMQPKEIAALIEELKLLGQYNYIVVDMTSSLNRINMELLKNCSSILTIAMKDKVSQGKLRILLKEYEILLQRENISLLDKSIFILNKMKVNETDSDIACIKPVNYSCFLPHIDNEDKLLDIIMADTNFGKLIASL